VQRRNLHADWSIGTSKYFFLSFYTLDWSGWHTYTVTNIQIIVKKHDICSSISYAIYIGWRCIYLYWGWACIWYLPLATGVGCTYWWTVFVKFFFFERCICENIFSLVYFSSIIVVRILILRVLLTSVPRAFFKHSKISNSSLNKVKYFNFQCIN
jgi:hypothetical protein